MKMCAICGCCRRDRKWDKRCSMCRPLTDRERRELDDLWKLKEWNEAIATAERGER